MMALPAEILVVDDNPGNMAALEAVLARPDIVFVRAASGEEAMVRIRERDYAVVILDVQMPGMDGFEAGRRIRASERNGATPIIFLTAYDADPPQVRKAYASGAVDFVIKPFDPQILWSKVSVFVDLFRKGREILVQGQRLVAAQAAAQAAAVAEARREWEAAALRARIERERDEASARELELKRIDRLKDEFLATLAHELRSPLMALLAVAEVLRRQPVEDPVLARRHEIVHRQIAHLCRLVGDSLEMSRFTQGKIEIRLESLDVRDAVERAVELSQTGLDARGVQLSVSLPAEPLYIAGDQVRLTQVVSNLLDNAGKFNVRGGQVWVNVEAIDGKAVIKVRDSGRGIAPERLGQIFEPFVQAEAGDASRGGLGIGLALVKRLVELHGGAVSAASTGAGQGAELVVKLPLPRLPPLAGELAPAEAAADPPPEAATAVGARVLVVDDNPEIRSTVQLFLQLEGHEVATADCGQAALDQIRQIAPDVVLLDIALPDFDGYAVAERVRAAHAERRPRLIAMTGNAGPGDRERALRAGFDAHVAKPVDARVLLRLIAGPVP
jgi:signal transduction histidine kinase